MEETKTEKLSDTMRSSTGMQQVATTSMLKKLIKNYFNEFADKNQKELNLIKDEAIKLNEETRSTFEKI